MASVCSMTHHLPVYESTKTIIELFRQTPQKSVTPCDHNELFEVKAITLTGRVLSLNIRPLDKVLRIKQQIYEQDGLWMDQQRLVFNGKRLEDDTLIHEYGIQANARIHLILRLRGGMFHASSSRNDYLTLSYKSKELVEKGLSMIKYMRNKYPSDIMDKIYSIILECKEDEIASVVNTIELYYIN
jgi:hypothetical protein